MKRKLLFPLIIAATFTVGIAAGQVVRADSGAVPGSSDDPLVTKSYVDQLNAKITSLQNTVNSLKGTVASLTTTVNSLKGTVITPPKTSTSTYTVTKTATVTATSLNLRATPSTKAQIITRLNRGNAVKVLGQSSIWYRVQSTSGKIGWVAGNYIKIK